MSNELKSCPFCGNDAIIFEIGVGAAFRVKCLNALECGVETRMFDYRKEAIAAWNHRVPPEHFVDANKSSQPNPPLTLEELREMGGEPVWIEDWWQNFHGWELSDDASDYCSERDTKQYGKLWFAYRHKLEED